MFSVKQAANIIKEGGVVAFPTETVFGIGANALDQDACLSIYKAKGRPAINPLIVHLASAQHAEEFAIFNEDARKLAEFWPGPLTMVLPKKEPSKIAKCVTAGLDTIAVRVSSHEVLQDLINISGLPIAAPSANKSGMLSPTSYEHVYSNFHDEVPIVEYKDKTTFGLESTIIDLSTDNPTILRYGFITPENIEEILGKKVQISSKNSSIKAPGMMLKHYAPKTKIRLNAKSALQDDVALNFADSNLSASISMNLSENGDLSEAAANLFDYLHQLDMLAQQNDLHCIAISEVPNRSIGLAINDRLMRAAES